MLYTCIPVRKDAHRCSSRARHELVHALFVLIHLSSDAPGHLNYTTR